jgi:hypothetical protein
MTERLGVDLLLTCVPESSIEPIYGGLRRRGVRIEPTLTGYVPISIDESVVCPMQDRALDVAYRAREVPFCLGRLGQEKVNIGKEFKARCAARGLREDINWTEESRIYGNAWFKFLASSRATLGTESGSSICDFTGDIDRAVKAYLAQHPGARFDEVERAILAPYEGNVVINVVSPRVFEAAFLRTVLILYPGEYSKVLEQGRHFIRLDKDFSNFDDVAEQIRDTRHVEAIADRAHRDLVQSGHWSYARFAADVDRLIEEEWTRRVLRRAPPAPRHLSNGSETEPPVAISALPPREDWCRLIAAMRPSTSSDLQAPGASGPPAMAAAGALPPATDAATVASAAGPALAPISAPPVGIHNPAPPPQTSASIKRAAIAILRRMKRCVEAAGTALLQRPLRISVGQRITDPSSESSPQSKHIHP